MIPAGVSMLICVHYYHSNSLELSSHQSMLVTFVVTVINNLRHIKFGPSWTKYCLNHYSLTQLKSPAYFWEWNSPPAHTVFHCANSCHPLFQTAFHKICTVGLELFEICYRKLLMFRPAEGYTCLIYGEAWPCGLCWSWSGWCLSCSAAWWGPCLLLV